MGNKNILNFQRYNHNEETVINNFEENKDIFEDMEEIKDEIYVGNGIKKMKGYKCNLEIDKLYQKRENFWKFVTNSGLNKNWTTWKIIQRAVNFDEISGPLLLDEYKIKCKNGCINHLIDEKGEEYIIPNYCINEPYFEKKMDTEKLKIILLI